MSLPAVHDVESCRLTIRDVHIPPSGEDDFVSFEFVEDLTAVDANDGQRIRQMNPGRKNGVCRITVSPYSVAHRRLGELYQAQKGATARGAATARFPGWPFAYINESNGTAVVAGSCMIAQAPGEGAAATAGTVEWVIDLAQVTRAYGKTIADLPL